MIKLAGEMLAKRTKDLRLTGWYLESVLRKEGFGQLVPGLELQRKLEEQYWDTIHPQLDEDGSADMRMGAVEGAAALLATTMKAIPLTRNGFNFLQYQDARALGLESEATNSDKAEARADAIARGRATGEDLQKAIDNTPKAFYAETEASLNRGLELLDELDQFHEEKYGDDSPSLGKLRFAVEEVKKVVSGILSEKRKTDPDPVAAGAEPEEESVEDSDPFDRFDQVVQESNIEAPAVKAPARKKMLAGAPTDLESAYAQVAACAEFLRGENRSSPVPYLLCSALRFGETRSADINDGSFAVAPSTETRQALRRLANESNWDDLMKLCLQTMAEPCGRVWLDLQRYAWRASNESSNYGVANAVLSTVRGLLIDMPSLRQVTLDDDTPAANAETLQWIDSVVLPPAVASEPSNEPSYETPVYSPAPAPAESSAPDIYETAQQILKQGKVSEAISLLVRDSESQPSGRMRFLRRVQLAQLCIAAEKSAVAYPVLLDLSNEMERRALETWEAAEMLAQPLSLLLRCLDQKKGTEDAREDVFARLCRLDPQAALTVRR